MRVRYGKNVGITRPGILKSMTSMLRALMGKVDNMQEQIGNIRSEKNTIRNKQKC